MSDDAFKELMKSPLEEPRRRRRDSRKRAAEPRRGGSGGGGGSWVPALVGMVVGAIVVLAGYLVAGTDDPADEAAGVTTTITTTTTLAASNLGFPAGYTVVNERIAVRPERILQREATTYVSFSSVVAAGLDPDETAGLVGGLWELELRDGSTVTSEEDFFDPLARGTFTVAFPAVDTAAITGVRLVGEALRTTNGFTSEYAFDPPLPFAADQVDVFLLEDSLELQVDSFELSADGGRIEWHLEGSPDVVASVDLYVETEDGSGRVPGDTLFESQSSGFRRNFGTTIAPEPAARSGVIGLEPMDFGNPESTYAARGYWTISWISYLPTDVLVPIEDVPVHTSGA